MCGICGIAIPDQARGRIERETLVRMRDALGHRGPDDAGLLIDSNIGLGHRRLSIVDLGGGHQPMANEDETVWIVYNGEVYNHRDLRPGLEASGHRYRTNSDTETIIHLYEEQGAKCVEQLRGMFAFAIWDRTRGRLVLARDRLGIKPLYYTLREDGTLHFASEIKSLLEAGAVRPELNYNALADYAANRYTSGEETLFNGIKRLAPGHVLTWSNGNVKVERYWDLSFAKPAEQLSEAEYVERFTELFRESVKLRLMSDVPLGVFLSGGIDSSAIVWAMSGLVREPVKTFSVSFAEREANELEYARLVSRRFGTDHHEVVVTPREFFDALPSMIYQEDEPLAFPSSIPLYFVSRLASDHVKVVLTGEGSDEALAGYSKYRKTVYNLALGRAYQSIPLRIRRAVREKILSLDGAFWARKKLSRTFLCLEPDIESIYFDNFSVFSRSTQERLFSRATLDRLSEHNPYRAPLDHITGSGAESLLDRLLAADMKTYLHELLMKQDQMSMAASIESRVPFLDHKLVEFAAALPAKMKLRGVTTKYVLRRAMKGRLPAEILTRRKMGFPVPIGSWLRREFTSVVDEYILSPRALERGIFNPEFVREVVSRHNKGENRSEQLWSLLNFEIWQRRFLEGEVEQCTTALATAASPAVKGRTILEPAKQAVGGLR
jgi:asparagine synthase (glutamine-hydrolysing)